MVGLLIFLVFFCVPAFFLVRWGLKKYKKEEKKEKIEHKLEEVELEKEMAEDIKDIDKKEVNANRKKIDETLNL